MSADPTLDVRLLGSVEVVRDGEPVELGGPQQRAVVAWLALGDGRVLAAEKLIERLWGDEAPSSATGTLQSYISRLRRALEPARAPGEPPRVLVSEAPGYALRVDRAQIDVFRFEDAAARGAEALTARLFPDALHAFDEALATWRGDPVAGAGGDASWEGVLVRLREMRAVAVEGRFDALLGLGQHAAIVGALHEAVAEEPLRERRWAQLALALYRSHRQSDALRVLANARETLVEQIGVDPGPELQQLEAQVLAQAPELAWSGSPVEPPPAASGTRVTPAGAGSGARTDAGTLTSAAGSPPLLVPPVAGARGGPVGRDLEWTRLTSAIGTGALGQPVVVVVEGDAGIGKTTLLDVLTSTATTAGWTVSRGRCVDEGLAPALWPWVEVVRSLAASRTADAPLTTGLARFAGLDGNGDERTGSLVELADDLVRAVVEAPDPQLIVLDDIHWADAATLDLVALVAQRLVGGRVVLAVAHRPVGPDSPSHLAHALAAIGRLPVVERLSLRGLSRDAVAALMSEVAGDAFDEAEVDAVHARTAGNPLFVAELARSPRALRDASGTAGAVHGDVPVPDAVRDVVRTRVRHLSPATMDVVVLAGLLGGEVDLKVLAAASGRDLDTCLDDLDPAVVSRVLVPAEQGRFAFGHALVRDALVHDLSPLKRARLHSKLADALESLHGADRDHAEPIAMHRWAALAVGDPLQAGGALVRAAGAASNRGAQDRAAELIELALTAIDAAPASPERLTMEIDALEAMLTIETLRTFMGERLDLFADRIDAVAARHDSDVARVLALFTRWSNINRGQYAAVDRWAEAARDLANRSTAPYVRLMGLHTWGSHCWLRGWISEAVATFAVVLDEEDALYAAGREAELPPLNHGANAAPAFAAAGDDARTAHALASSERTLRPKIARAPSTRVDAVFVPALAASVRHDVALVRDVTAGLVRGDIDIEHPHFSPACRIMHGWAWMLTEGDPAALDLIGDAIATIDATPVKVAMSFFRSLAAEALLHAGRTDEAVALLRDVAAGAERDGDGWWLPETLRLLAVAEARAGAAAADVAPLLERARAIALEQGEHLLVARIDATRTEQPATGSSGRQ